MLLFHMEKGIPKTKESFAAGFLFGVFIVVWNITYKLNNIAIDTDSGIGIGVITGAFLLTHFFITSGGIKNMFTLAIMRWPIPKNETLLTSEQTSWMVESSFRMILWFAGAATSFVATLPLRLLV